LKLMFVCLGVVGLATSNPTYEELKWSSICEPKRYQKTSNPTYKELKSRYVPRAFSFSSSSNPTYEELK